MAKSKDVDSQIKRVTRRRFSADEKIRIVLEGFLMRFPGRADNQTY
ncbi:MAG: hypothetical protein JW810_00845 [Sedimentisphaerales bacterium]|nr:hypothetical protein [Sedimentisphaerales bacterium]